jgi:hypothetical protein
MNTNNSYNEPSINKNRSDKITVDIDASINTRKRHSEFTTDSQSKYQTQEKSPTNDPEKRNSVSQNISNFDSSSPKKRMSSPSNSTKKARSKSNLTVNKKQKRRVAFEKNFVNITYVESYKKYNVDMSYNDPEPQETTRCRCIII